MGNQAFAVWKGKNDPALYWSMTDVNGTWRPQKNIPNVATSRGVAATLFRGSAGVLAAWRGMDADNCIWTATFDSGWSVQQRPDGAPRTEDRPGLALFRGNVAMAWRGAGADQMIWFAQRKPNGTWSAQVPVPGASSSHGPALATFKDRLYMAWRGPDNDQRLSWARFDGSTWTTPAFFKGGSTHGPALAATQGTLSMAWKGAGNDSLLWRASYTDRWSVQSPAVGHSTHGPSLSTISDTAGVGGAGAPMMMWKGMGNDQSMWSSVLWKPQVSVAKGAFGTSDSPAIVSVSVFTL